MEANTAERRIDDAELVDALDQARATLTSTVITILDDNVKACQHYAAHGSKTDAAKVPELKALRELVRVIVESGR